MSRELELARELVRKLEEAEKDNKVQLSELQPGETFKIGEHDFIVLEQNGCSGTTNVISKGFMSEDIVFDDDTKDYNNSNLKKIIEENIQPAIEAGVGSVQLPSFRRPAISAAAATVATSAVFALFVSFHLNSLNQRISKWQKQI